ncbi:MAG: zinc-binding alcohol dehydrogenase [Abditibacteriales bacterium]|nr:zinc-binding alcohol dehydrogenase [Abditibacteriales bacterium]MDW8366165.1 zinc-binding alcohol dehydrogenase [Abditibacteriales bacterium]
MRNIGIEYPARGAMRFCDLGAPPQPKDSEILIDTHYSGISNGTERHALLGEHGWVHFPGRHGYQHVGTVRAVGSKVRDFKSGDWVFHGRYVGHRGWHVVDVTEADVDSIGSHLCLRLPDDVDYKHCALLGVAGVAMRHVRRCRVAPAQNVWVVGLGLIGQFAAQSARAVGARVTATDVNERRLAVAEKLGAHRVLDARDDKTNAALKADGPYDCILDCSGVPSLLPQIHRDGLLAYRGVIGLLAVRSETTFPWSMLHGREGSIEVSCHFGLDDLRRVLHFVRQGVIRVEPLISHCVSIDQAPTIYETLRDRPGELLGVVFDWTTEHPSD